MLKSKYTQWLYFLYSYNKSSHLLIFALSDYFRLIIFLLMQKDFVSHDAVMIPAIISHVLTKPIRRRKAFCFFNTWEFDFRHNDTLKYAAENIQFNGIWNQRNEIPSFGNNIAICFLKKMGI